MKRALLGWGLAGQGIELCDRCETFCPFLDHQLPVLQHVHELNPGEGTLCCISGGLYFCTQRLTVAWSRDALRSYISSST